MELIQKEDIQVFANPGVVSRQLLNPDNSQSRRITLTEVRLEPGACQPRHTHERSEQIWYAVRGVGKLLLAEGQEREFRAGDVARFEEGDVHGLENSAQEEFVYISVTAPPIHFGYAYHEKEEKENEKI